MVGDAFRRGEPRQADRRFAEPWSLDAWPDVPTCVIAGRRDRLLPFEFLSVRWRPPVSTSRSTGRVTSSISSACTALTRCALSALRLRREGCVAAQDLAGRFWDHPESLASVDVRKQAAALAAPRSDLATVTMHVDAEYPGT